jgi:chemotaxis protein MotB
LKKKKSSGGANWMDTYGDMVTLLLCFFVLLYSMSTLDQQKWTALVRSFNPDAIPEVTETTGNNGPVAEPTDPSSELDAQDVKASIEKLYQDIQDYINQQGAQNNVSVTKGDGYVFISLNNTVFFNGDSYVLREEGKHVLNDLGAIFGHVSASIDEVRILGHTAQATANDLNDPTVDRFLASNRAAVVLVYLQEMNILDPARLISVGYGQWRPISSNDTSQTRAKNRRVEIIITGKNVENKLGDSITQYYTVSGTTPPTDGEATANQTTGSDTTPP